MQLFLNGKNFVISDRIRRYVEEKIGGLDRYLPDIREIRVEISEEKTRSRQDKHVIQATLRADGAILRAEERTNAVYAGIDVVAGKIHRQIARYKGKRIDRWHGHLQHNQRPDQMPPLDPEILADLAEEEEREIVRVKRFLITPMNEEEAIEQMELLGHDFFVFYNADLGRINVLYRRLDDNYGLLDPELA